MANVTVTCRNFTGPFAAINGVRSRDISQRAVLRAVVTVGAQRFLDVFSFGLRGLVHRFGMGLSAVSFLEQSPAGLCVAARYRSLDGSEKGAVTYWYGMALAKIVAEIELGIPWLAHVDQMRASGALTITSGSSERGDLVGRDARARWHVVEAKGRSNSYPQSLVDSAKGQSARVTAINSQSPATTFACIASLSTQPISVLVDDPPPEDDGNGEQWRIREDDFFKQYYRSIIEYLRSYAAHEENFGGADFVVAPLFPFLRDYVHPSPLTFESWQLRLGLLKSIYETPERASDAQQKVPRDDEGKVGGDGIAVFGAFCESGED